MTGMQFLSGLSRLGDRAMKPNWKQERVLNIYGQPMEHMEARIVGNRAALEALCSAIRLAIVSGKATLGKEIALFALDGEGYRLDIKCKPDSWWTDTSPDDLPFYHRNLEEGLLND